MKYRYKFHPYDYALGENEKFYSDMESKGWRVVKRGSYLSKFAPVKPGKTRYRIEVVSPGFFMEDGCTMPPEQRAVYEDCGWEYVLGRDLFHLFRAPEDSEAPEFYANPDEQLPTIESLRKQRWWGWIGPVFVFIWNLFSRKFRAFGAMGTFYTWFKILVKQPAIFGVCVFSFLWLLYLSLRQTWYINRTCRSLRQGVPLDHDPQERHLAHKITNGTLLVLLILCSVLAVIGRIGNRVQNLPVQADGPYLVLSDLGREAERRSSDITRTITPLADIWNVGETLEDDFWMRQEVYRLRSPKLAQRFAAVLRNSRPYGRKDADCSYYVLEDMEVWHYDKTETVAVCGDMAAYIYYYGSPEPLTEALRERWAEYGKTEEGSK